MDAASSSNFLSSTPSTWVGQLNLALSKSGERTRVAHAEHRGPLRIQRPFYPEQNGTAHIYILHPPGGVAGGDHLGIDVEVNPVARALITAPAANKLYCSEAEGSRIRTKIVARDASLVEWLPQETIAFSGARSELSTVVQLEEGARFIGWELLCLGRPAAAESFERGFVHQSLELWREETPLFVDRTRVGQGFPTQQAIWGLGGKCVVGTMLIATDGRDQASSVREVLSESPVPGSAAVTDLTGVTVVRYVGDEVRQCWRSFVHVWAKVRPLLVGSPAHPPRIWSY